MDEVDNIIIANLKSLACPLSATVSKLEQLDAPDLYKVAVFCLAQSQSSAESLPQALPGAMAARVNACSNFVNILKSAGFRGEASYHTVLYPNVLDTRRLLMWLIDSMPSKQIAEIASSSGGASVGKKIEKLVASQGSITWRLESSSKCSASSLARQSGGHSAGRQRSSLVTWPLHLPLPTECATLKPYKRYCEKNLKFTVEQVASACDTACSSSWSIWSAGGSNSGSSGDAPAADFYLRSGVRQLGASQLEHNAYHSFLQAAPATLPQKRATVCGQMAALLLQESLRAGTLHSADSLHLHAGTSDWQWAGGKFRHQAEFEHRQSNSLPVSSASQPSEEERLAERAAAEAALQSAQSALMQDISASQSSIRAAGHSLLLGQSKMQSEVERRVALEHAYSLLKRTHDLLPDAAANMAQLHQLTTESSSRLLHLAEQWEQVRQPLLLNLRNLMRIHSLKLETWQELSGRVEQQQAAGKELAQRLQAKDSALKQLADASGRLSGDTSRAVYTRRIVEIVGSVKKQMRDMDGVLLDTRKQHHELNALADTLNRTFAIADELLFSEAKKCSIKSSSTSAATASSDASKAKGAYKCLVALNDHFKKLAEHVAGTGSSRNAQLTIEAKLNGLTQQTANLDSSLLFADLDLIRADNLRLSQLLNVPH